MIPWQIQPFVGVGPLRFGTTRQIVRQQVGPKFSSFHKVRGSVLTDSYDQIGVHLYYDADDLLEFVEAFSRCQVAYKDVRPLGENVDTIVAVLRQMGHEAREYDAGYHFPDAGFSVYVEHEDSIESVGVFRKGYLDKVVELVE